MTIVGQQLTAPEVGWKRIDSSNNENISLIGTWASQTDASGAWQNTSVFIPQGTSGSEINASAVRFNFTGTKIRFIQTIHPDHATNIRYVIDGVDVGQGNAYGSPYVRQVLIFEQSGLLDGEHCVEVKSGDSVRFDLDAIDIDENGELLPYNPTPENPGESDQAILRVTMIDSSEREYKLSMVEITEFVDWYDREVGTGTTVYVLNKMTGSKEYLAFDKIISFEVIEIK